MELLLDSESERTATGSFSVFISSNILITADGDYSGLMPMAGSELLASRLLARVCVTTGMGLLFLYVEDIS